MNISRFNVFNQIHKGLRALLFDTALQVQQTDFTDTQKAESVLTQVELLLSMFDSHAYHEDTCILEDVAKYNKDFILEFEREHQTDLSLSAQLHDLIKACKHASTSEQQYIAGNQLLYALNDFIAFNLNHMNREELELNKVLWTHYTDEEIMQMEHRIQSLVPPEKLAVYFKWMIRGLNDPEITGWLNAVKSNAPDFVFQGLLNECAINLTGERWQAINLGIAENV